MHVLKVFNSSYKYATEGSLVKIEFNLTVSSKKVFLLSSNIPVMDITIMAILFSFKLENITILSDEGINIVEPLFLKLLHVKGSQKSEFNQVSR